MIFPTKRPVLMAILDEASAGSAEACIQGGVDLIQVRARGLSLRLLADLVRRVAHHAGPDRVLVNSRADVVELTATFGVQLPESGIPPSVGRRHFPGLLVGVSRHDRDGLLRAQDEGADFALLGPAFKTPGKVDRALGVDRFAALIDGLSMPVLGVGGVEPETAGDLLTAGAAGIAAIRPFSEPGAARRRAESFRAVLDGFVRI